MRTIKEKMKETVVTSEVDVLVAGGGPAGIAAAISAARNGVGVLLVERYGCLGGLATGGLVICLVETARYGYGVCREMMDQLSELKAVKLNRRSRGISQWVEGASFSGEESWLFNPDILKFVADKLVIQSGATVLFHSLVVDSIMKGNEIEGVMLEGKSGRHAVLGKVIVDCTGDGDIAASSGAPYQVDRHPWGVNLEFRIGNVDVQRVSQWQKENPEAYNILMGRLEKEVGKISWGPTADEGVVWGHTPRYFWNVDGLNVWDLTKVEIESRRMIVDGFGFLRRSFPGFERAFLLDMASQIGVRETRRIVGEYTLTKKDALAGKRFEDSIAQGPFAIPYRCLVPKEIDDLLMAGRCISTTHEAQGVIRNIPPCLVTGQVAGTAAALAITKGVKPRDLDILQLQESLRKQDVTIETSVAKAVQ
jgi:2-polyprenyl-6-methoxyphenol hydroxylase-like FAD-dependent oxidoreductase